MGNEGNFYYDLFARPSVLEGLARTLDISGDFDVYNVGSTAKEADLRALRNDWSHVSFDLHGAVKKYGQEIQKKETS